MGHAEAQESPWAKCADPLQLRQLANDKEFDAPMLSTTYQSWWTFKPREVAKKCRAKLRKILYNEAKPPKLSTTKAKGQAHQAAHWNGQGGCFQKVEGQTRVEAQEHAPAVEKARLNSRGRQR
jgi:hypothetical protein